MIIMSIAILILVIDNIRIRLNNVKYKSLATKAIADIEIIKDVFQKEIKSRKDDSTNEAMIRFLSESRDMAFEYIEKVQKTVSDTVTALDPHVVHFDKFGLAVSTPYDNVMGLLSKEIKNLKELLPDTDNNEVK